MDGFADGVGVVAVDIAHHMPAVGFEALGRIVGKPTFDMAVNGDAVVVIKADQLAQPRVPASEQASWEMPSIKQPSPRNT